MYPMTQIPQFQLNQIDNEAVRAAYHEHGFVLIDNVLSTDERAEIRSDLAKINLGTTVVNRFHG